MNTNDNNTNNNSQYTKEIQDNNENMHTTQQRSLINEAKTLRLNLDEYKRRYGFL